VAALVAVRIERPLKPLGDVVAFLVVRSGRNTRCQPAAGTRTTDEEQLSLVIGAQRIQLGHQLIKERSIRAAIRKRLPFDKNRLSAKRRKFRRPYESPFGSSPHIDQNGFRVGLEARPYVFDWHIIDCMLNRRWHLLSPNKLKPQLSWWPRPPDFKLWRIAIKL
jgi:hypothetical protein